MKKYKKVFGEKRNIRIFFAPGRVNLIGEHTDYNGGFVLPAAFQFGTYVAISKRSDGAFRLVSTDFPNMVSFTIDQLTYRAADGWGNYPKGVIKFLFDHLKSEDKYHLSKGADILYQGNMPIGAGLSSSASIGMATAFAITKVFSCEISRFELAHIAQRAENLFIGVDCGIMDPFVIGMGRAGNTLFLRCDTLEYEYIPFFHQGIKVIITNTKRNRRLIESVYNTRKKECEKALKIIQNKLTDLSVLGELSYKKWNEIKFTISSEIIRRRVEHVVSENERVSLAVKCLKKKDLHGFGELMIRSHESLRDNYGVTGTEQDMIFEEAMRIEGCYGSRMTGAGFGGCHISLVRSDIVSVFKDIISKKYFSKFRIFPDFFILQIGDGVKEISF